MNYIELFAGCGGLSLGLDSLGFELIMANELSPMASETYAYNFFKEDLTKAKTSSNVLWLSSRYEKSDLNKRLREDPRSFPPLDSGASEVSPKNIFNGNLVVGNIVQLNNWLENHPEATQHLNEKYKSQGGIDLISGGPPCQSFSMAGLRQLDNDRNSLPWEFVKFVSKIKPKFVLLENVTGILRAFKADGKEFYAWYEVAKSFAQTDYIPLCLHINAKYVGVAQNRPRYIYIGVRNDIFQKISKKFNSYEQSLFDGAQDFVRKANKNINLQYGELNYFDIEQEYTRVVFKNSFLSPLIQVNNFVSVKEAIDDIRQKGKHSYKSDYLKNINKNFKKSKNQKLENHEYRNNSLHVQRRFRIYQILLCLTAPAVKETKELLKGKATTLSDSTFHELKLHGFLMGEDNYVRFNEKEELINFLNEHRTKKQTQKALVSVQPAPATLSIPDDTCHYHQDELRTLTVREMARIQSFPDSFIFCSKVTTGGQMRKFEVPQYTQVGNAVPPLLGRALGQVIQNLASFIEPETSNKSIEVNSIGCSTS